ncbi:cation:proton antiporter [Rubrobacter aplysinae]|uniref:cation:proton antiporter n=1 Tax=Rubrobacter aplysinae TaxID=909625 RepID=UPI00069F15DF|nr:cation:proton antiporter [Rubrobacter aplysinae]
MAVAEPLLGLGGVVAAGVGAQWLAARLGIPSILCLLLVGLLVGPVTGIIDPDALLGDLLSPVASLLVSVILFEGGLNLRVAEVRGVRRAVRGLISVGVLLTWLLTSVAAYYLLGLGIQVSVLLGALLVVSGPTVVLPLLEHARPRERLNSALKWEGILVDPIGAILAVLVFQGILAASSGEEPASLLAGFALTVLAGLLAGAAGGGFLFVVLLRGWVPEHLRNGVTLAVVLLTFAVSDLIRAESGLLAVTLMGLVLANQRRVAVEGIIDFKEELRELFLAILFILLSARLGLEELGAVATLGTLFFVLGLVLVVRPLAVLASTYRSGLSGRERAFLSWMAPRGIVAASVASVFGLKLSAAGVPGAEALAPLAFLVILATVAVYGLSAAPVARRLGVSRDTPEGGQDG